MATQKKVAQSRAQATIQQSSPGKTEVPPKREASPRTLAEAIAKGFEIIGEEFHGELNRRGHFTLQRVDKPTGDCEYLTVPFTARLKVGPPRGSRIDRHAYLTPKETMNFEKRARGEDESLL